MAKTLSPLWSLRAWGSIGEAAGAFWSGSSVSRVFRRESSYTQLQRHFIPANPQTSLQQANRYDFSSAVSGWQGLSDEQKAAWGYYQDYCRRRPVMSGYNLYISKYLLSDGNPEIPPSGRKGFPYTFPIYFGR